MKEDTKEDSENKCYHLLKQEKAGWKEISRRDGALISLLVHVRIELCPLPNGAGRYILNLESQLHIGERRTASV